MSVVRFSENSDLYIYGGENGLECCGCKLAEGPGWLITEDALEMIHHVEAHLVAGHKVPRGVVPILAWDAVGQQARDLSEAYGKGEDVADVMHDLQAALNYVANDPAPEQPAADGESKLAKVLNDAEADRELRSRHLDEWREIRETLT